MAKYEVETRPTTGSPNNFTSGPLTYNGPVSFSAPTQANNQFTIQPAKVTIYDPLEPVSKELNSIKGMISDLTSKMKRKMYGKKKTR